MAFFFLCLFCLVQGITEFLPVSSSLHLDIIAHLLAEPSLLYMGRLDILFHAGTLVAIMVYFKDDIVALLCSFFSFFRGNNDCQKNTPYRLFLGRLIMATLPTLLIGFFLKIFKIKIQNHMLMGISSIFFGALMFYADKNQERGAFLTKRGAFLIGCAQSLAFIPGASRLGCTLTAARFLKLSRCDAFRFSFIASIPVVAGAVFLDGVQMYQEGVEWREIPFWVIGVTAGIGFVTLHGMMSYLKKYSLVPFAIYRILLGIGLLLSAI